MTEPEAAIATTRGSGRSSALIAAGIFLSRLLGLLRQSLIATYLGAGVVSDAFNGAFRITNILQNLFGEGALSASFIPVYANALERGDEKEADRIAGAVAAILGLVVAVIVLVGVVAAPHVVQIVVGGFTGDKLELTIRLTRILFPGAGIFVMSAWCLGILNSHRKFFLSYAAPVFWNLAIGAALQMGVQLPSVFALLRHPRFRPDIGYPPVREVVRNFAPAFISRGVVQLSGYVDIWLASFIRDHGIVTLLQNAQTIYMLPISLFGMAISAAELPEMSRDTGVGAEALARIRTRLNAALPRVAFFVVPSAIGFLVLGEAIAGVLLEHGKFTRVDSIRTWAILAGSAIGLVASTLGRLYSSTFYALRDTRTPLWFAIGRVVLTGVLGYLFAFPVPRLLGLAAWTGAVGLTASAGIAGWVEFLLLRRAISARIGRTGIPAAALLRLWGAGLLAGAAGWGVMRLMDPAHQTMRGIVALVAFAICYGVVTLGLGVPEARSIAARVGRR
jgi:putative peptidoglycan lipid II flippase